MLKKIGVVSLALTLALTLTSDIAFATMTVETDTQHSTNTSGITTRYQVVLQQTSAPKDYIVEAGPTQDFPPDGYVASALAIDYRGIPYALSTPESLNKIIQDTGGWGFDDRSSFSKANANIWLKDYAKKYFDTWKMDFKYFDNVLDTSKWAIQHENGKTFIANTLYFLYKGTGLDNPATLASLGYTNGPYITKGNVFDDTVMFRDIYAGNPSDYIMPASSLTGNSSSLQSGGYYWYNRSSIYQKHAEVRLEIVDGVGGEVQFIYPEEVQEWTYSRPTLDDVPDAQPQIEITPVNNSSGIIDSYNVQVSTEGIDSKKYISPAVYSWAYGGVEDPRTAQEPAIGEMKVWYSDMVGKLNVYTASGKLVKTISIPTGTYSQNISLESLGNENLDGGTIKVNYTYTKNGRYMSDKKEIYDKYTQDNTVGAKSYDDVTKELTSVTNKLNEDALKNVIAYHKGVNPTVTETFQTISEPDLEASASANIFYVSANKETVPLQVSVEVYPAQPTTTLEGGTFYINVHAEGLDGEISETIERAGAPHKEDYSSYSSSIPSGEKKIAKWQSDIKFTSIQVIAQDGHIIYDSKSKLLSSSDKLFITNTQNPLPVHILDSRLPGKTNVLKASETDIGNARIVVSYEYRYKIREMTSSSDHRTGSQRRKHYHKTFKTTYDVKQTGTQVFPFTIYSLSSETTPK